MGYALLNEMRGTLWKPHPGKAGHKIPTRIEDVEGDEEEPGEVVIDIDGEIFDDNVYEIPASKFRSPMKWHLAVAYNRTKPVLERLCPVVLGCPLIGAVCWH